jgi:NTE family protein
VDLLFDGGGVTAIALAGAYVELEQRGYAPRRIAGSSGGAIIATLVAAGYSGSEIARIVHTMPLPRFRDGRRPPYRGDFLLEWIRQLLSARGIERFGQLVDEGAEEPYGRWRLCIIASDLTHGRMLVLPQDAPHLGIDPDEMDIADAVRMSMSIPGFFKPVAHRDPRTAEPHVIVDGGVLSGRPVWLFDCRDRDPRWPTFGLVMVEGDPNKSLGARAMRARDEALGPAPDVQSVVAAVAMEGRHRHYIEDSHFARTIPIQTLGIASTEFGITPALVQASFNEGARAVAEFLAHWDFAAYVDNFRRGGAWPSRREQVSGPRLVPAVPASEADDPFAADVVPDGIFINHRRGDVDFAVDALHTSISANFGDDRVFRDIDSIGPGDDWEAAVLTALARTRVMLVVIGPGWATGADPSAPSRLSNPDDWVRREIEGALERSLRVIPVLIGRDALPSPEELPDSMTGLLRHQQVEIRTSTRQADIRHLVGLLERIDEALNAP